MTLAVHSSIKGKTTSIAALICLFSTTSTHAIEWDRFSGEILFATVYTHSDSNLYTEGNPYLGNTGSRSATGDKVIFTPLGNVNYALNDERTELLYIGTSRDDLSVGTLAFELGYQTRLSSGTTLDLAYLPTIVPGEVWADPYVTNKARDKTDVDGGAFRVKLSNISQSRFSLDMAYAFAEVDNDAVTYESLKRDSNAFYIKGHYLTMLDAQSGINYGVTYTLHDADGKANSHDKYSAEATYFYQSTKHGLALTATYIYRAYGSENPVFNDTRSDNAYRLFAAYEYKNLPNWDNWSVVAFAGTTKTHSSIDFFESRDWLLSASLNYKF